MRIFTCEFIRLADQLIDKADEVVRIGDPNLDEHNMSELISSYVEDLLDKEFNSSDDVEDVILFQGHYKRAGSLLAAAAIVSGVETFRVLHFSNRDQEFIDEFITPPDDIELSDREVDPEDLKSDTSKENESTKTATS